MSVTGFQERRRREQDLQVTKARELRTHLKHLVRGKSMAVGEA